MGRFIRHSFTWIDSLFLATLSFAYISNVAFLLPSRWQLYVHLVIVAVFLFYNFLNRTANEHVGEVYYEEK